MSVTIDHQLAELSKYPLHRESVLRWLRDTWSDEDDPFSSTLEPDPSRPGALIALSAAEPLGVLSFKRFRAASQTEPTLWINALFVAPKCRRQGIGRRLIQFAMDHAAERFTEELFVYSHIPRMYEALGWRRLSYSAEHNSHTLVWGSSGRA
ncbi:MAG: GNAT family N-acetyltransferase [Planctomycetota bacterium]